MNQKNYKYEPKFYTVLIPTDQIPMVFIKVSSIAILTDPFYRDLSGT